MKEEILVSVCIPTYNRSLELRKTLESIVNQTYKNLDIIVSDNNSSDDTQSVIKSFMDKDKRIRCYKHKETVEGTKNFLTCVGQAKSEYVCVFHSDDIYEPEIIEKELKVLYENPDVGAVFSEARAFYNNDLNNNGIWDYSKVYKELKNNFKEYVIGGYLDYFPLILKHNSFFATPTLMTKKSLFLELNGLDGKYKQGADVDLWLRILKKGLNIAIVKTPLVNYRIHDGQDSNVYRDKNRDKLHFFFDVVDDFLKKDAGLVDKEAKDKYLKDKAFDYLIIANNCRLNRNREKYREYIKLSRKTFRAGFFSKFWLVQRFPILLGVYNYFAGR